jgi:hypothetical protein
MNETIDLALDSLPLLSALMLWLVSQPVWVGLAILIGSGALLSIFGALFMEVVATPHILFDNNLVGGSKFGFLAQVFAALLAFILIDGGLRYTQARVEVQTEASALRLFDSTLTQLNARGVPEVRKALRVYVTNVVESEFITMQLGKESAAARNSLNQLLTAYMRLENANEHDRLTRLQADQILTKALQSRQSRLGAIRPGLKNLIWGVVLVNTLISITFHWFFGSSNLFSHMAMGVLLSTAIVTVVYLALLLYHPFTGDLAISSRPFEYILHTRI